MALPPPPFLAPDPTIVTYNAGDDPYGQIAGRITAWETWATQTWTNPPLNAVILEAFSVLSGFADVAFHCPACGHGEGQNIDSRLNHAYACYRLQVRAAIIRANFNNWPPPQPPTGGISRKAGMGGTAATGSRVTADVAGAK